MARALSYAHTQGVVHRDGAGATIGRSQFGGGVPRQEIFRASDRRSVERRWFSRALVPFSAQSYDQLRGSERFAALVRKLGLDVALFTSPTGGRPQALHDIFADLEAALADGIIERYAIGGAVGATFYIEPSATQDVDVFVVFHHTPR